MNKPLDLIVKEAGIVGAGGAGFPTHVKLGGKPEIVIINGAECEPLLRVDQELLIKEQATIFKAIKSLQSYFQVEKIVLGIKEKYIKVIEAWNEQQDDGFSIFLLGDYYPAGDEHVLVESVTGRVIPPGGIPLDVGAVVFNVETLYNIGNAIEGHPVTDKYITLSGAVENPCTVKVPLGTSLAEVLDFAGDVTVDSPAYIIGGPVMGKATNELTEGVSKTTKGILVVPSELSLIKRKQLTWDVVRRRAFSSCEVCRFCTDLCPRYLLGHDLQPHRFMRLIAYSNKLTDPTETLNAMLCVECGVCEEYACPVGINPRNVMRTLKEKLIAAGLRYPADKKPVKARDIRYARRLPSSRLLFRLGLKKYDRPAPLIEIDHSKINKVIMSLPQPYGAPCHPLVKPGDIVNKGDLIGDVSENKLGAQLHAGISGKVSAVNDKTVTIIGKGGPA